MTAFKDLQHGTVNPFQLNTKAISYLVDKTLEQGAHRINLITNGTHTLGLWLDDTYVGMFCDGSLTFKLANDVYVENVIIKEYNELGEIESVKLEKGDIATDWTPAPEDLKQSKLYNLSQPIIPHNNYTLSLNTDKEWVGAKFLKDNLVRGYLNYSFSKEQVNIFSMNYLLGGRIAQEDFETIQTIVEEEEIRREEEKQRLEEESLEQEEREDMFPEEDEPTIIPEYGEEVNIPELEEGEENE